MVEVTGSTPVAPISFALSRTQLTFPPTLMSDSQNRILKGRAVTDEPRYCIFSFDVDLGRRQIKETICISGTQDEFALRNFSESFADFSAWAQEIRYYGKLDVRSTMDLEGVVKRLSHDVDFVDKAVEAIKTNDASKIEFVMGTELEHILGVKNVALEFFVQDKTYIKDSAASGASSTDEGGGPMIPLAFVLSPLQGVALTRIRLGERIVVKFANLKDQLTKNYRANNEPQDEKFPERSTAILKSLSEATGQNAIRAIVQLPGGALGEIIEESRNIRVRMAPAPPRHPKTSPGDVDAHAPMRAPRGPGIWATISSTEWDPVSLFMFACLFALALGILVTIFSFI